jgi:hypothetical protein
VQYYADIVQFKIWPQIVQEVVGIFPNVHVRGVTHGILAFGDLLVIRKLIFLAYGDVANLLEAKSDRIVHPYIHTMAKDGVKGLGHVQVSDTATSNAGCARTWTSFVKYDHIRARTAPARFQFHREMPRGA